MKAKDIKGKKFHYEGEDASGSVFLSECTDDDRKVVVRLDKPKSGAPIPMGRELCRVKPDDSGHFEIDESLAGPLFEDNSSGGGGPAMVATNEYRDGWDRTFGSKGVN